MSDVQVYNQATRLEGRNGRIYMTWCFGATQEAIAEEFNMSLNNVRRIIKQVEATAPEIARDDLRQRLQEASLLLSRQVLEIFNLDAPPVVDQKGMVVRDPDTGVVVRDYGTKLKAVETWLKVAERLTRLAGADAPAKLEVEHSANVAAQEQAAKVTGQFLTLVS